MGKEMGMLKYMLKAPLARPVNFFKYGGGFVAIWSAFVVISNSHTLAPDVLIDAYIAYLSAKYLPPTEVMDVVLPIVIGAFLAGLKWRAAMGSR